METLLGTDVARAAALLRAGELVAIPTETVYGLAGHGLREDSLQRIFAVKGRPLSNPLILHFASPEHLGGYVRPGAVPAAAHTLLAAFSPGPLTLLLSREPAVVPDTVTAGLPDVAVRIPAHPLVQQLLHQLDFPLAAPSANPFGYISPTLPEHVLRQLGGKIPYVLDGGPCEAGIESTVVGFGPAGEPVVYRPGAISLEALQQVVPTARLRTAAEKAQRVASPGLLPYHYSPHTPLQLFGPGLGAAPAFEAGSTGALTFREPLPGLPLEQQVVLSPGRGNLAEAAHGLYAALHHLDGLGLQHLLAERFPETGIGMALNERLEKAAARG
ncbi:threonylcarbamoyl-AMP synthase [Hymenobacter oligotrophus]|uniref:Threonylcarbamoyl-AMP synthase n=1 Tax=Hymenobacter oligotrophus TaxID=2319843 RepID=A0A3B7R0T0_9BACT|nr:L-threonylcarbamoyladenylate synthase [Hymenobacter oligotrophus]AYA37372.1 threonylcarbamoyl-AMP synthase [Hymenobacter oligotrophus]